MPLYIPPRAIRRTQPQFGTLFDPDNPLCEGLNHLWAFNSGFGGMVHDGVQNKITSSFGAGAGGAAPVNTAAWGTPGQGIQASTASATTNWLDAGAVSMDSGFNTLSLMVLVSPNSTTLRGDYIARWTNGAGSGDQFVFLQGVAGTAKFRFYVSDGTGTSNTGDSTTTFTTTGGPYLVGAVAYPSNCELWVNGKMENSNNAAKTINTTPSTSLRLFGDGNGTGNSEGANCGTMWLAAMWRRRVVAEEWAQLYDNPWQLYAPLPTRAYSYALAPTGTWKATLGLTVASTLKTVNSTALSSLKTMNTLTK